jgi:hypothetical protein
MIKGNGPVWSPSGSFYNEVAFHSSTPSEPMIELTIFQVYSIWQIR